MFNLSDYSDAATQILRFQSGIAYDCSNLVSWYMVPLFYYLALKARMP
jgi:hypothetical protein